MRVLTRVGTGINSPLRIAHDTIHKVGTVQFPPKLVRPRVSRKACIDRACTCLQSISCAYASQPMHIIQNVLARDAIIDTRAMRK